MNDGHGFARWVEQLQLSTGIAGLAWPAIPPRYALGQLALLLQLEASQWWPPEWLRAHQFGQLRNLLQHARETTSYYRERIPELPADLSDSFCHSLPLLTRRDVQTRFADLASRRPPRAHGRVATNLTSGSTGQPLKTLTTELCSLFWKVFTIREHHWQRRDARGTLAVVRHTNSPDALPPDGKRHPHWGSAMQGLFATGPAALLGTGATIAEQADWLVRVDPDYLLIYPSALLALAELFQATGRTLPRLKQVRTFGEIVEPRHRAQCRAAFGVELVDLYSSNEVGYIALQCPEHETYHVQSEGVLVEVLNEAGAPCRAGETGRVVITALHNFALPLIRYEIGDYAEVGEPCPCGRGLPTLRRIYGRQRNILRAPDGTSRWPSFAEGDRPDALPAFYQFQLVQRTLERLEMRVVRPAPFTSAEEATLRAYLQQSLHYPFEIRFAYLDEIPRNPTGKFEDFVSELE
ncbi:MAG: phenylacetate--CoA ligase family protein [Planctomycetaceae bacterium]|nr:phenylacetate--CoA ligase family protein [Planctomycetaceae bacterium]